LAGLTLSDKTIEAGAVTRNSAIPGARVGAIVSSPIRMNYGGSRTLDSGDASAMKRIGWWRR
jgi:hypothetical protein